MKTNRVSTSPDYCGHSESELVFLGTETPPGVYGPSGSRVQDLLLYPYPQSLPVSHVKGPV